MAVGATLAARVIIVGAGGQGSNDGPLATPSDGTVIVVGTMIDERKM
jgi:hypothetical protein